MAEIVQKVGKYTMPRSPRSITSFRAPAHGAPRNTGAAVATWRKEGYWFYLQGLKMKLDDNYLYFDLFGQTKYEVDTLYGNAGLTLVEK